MTYKFQQECIRKNTRDGLLKQKLRKEVDTCTKETIEQFKDTLRDIARNICRCNTRKCNQ